MSLDCYDVRDVLLSFDDGTLEVVPAVPYFVTSAIVCLTICVELVDASLTDLDITDELSFCMLFDELLLCHCLVLLMSESTNSDLFFCSFKMSDAS